LIFILFFGLAVSVELFDRLCQSLNGKLKGRRLLKKVLVAKS
jgi:hypothetical protein